MGVSDSPHEPIVRSDSISKKAEAKCNEALGLQFCKMGRT